eukprot:1393974-Amorphochlora_amoeboformis.AAC.2
MGGSLSIRNDEDGPVRAEIYSKTGGLVAAAHLPERHTWFPSAKLVQMMPYDVVVIDGTGLRWRLGIRAPSKRSDKMCYDVTEIEDGDFLAPTHPPKFPSALDDGVRPSEEPKNGYKTVVQDSSTSQAGARAVAKEGKDDTKKEQVDAYEAYRIESLRVLRSSFSKVELSNRTKLPLNQARVPRDPSDDVHDSSNDISIQEPGRTEIEEKSKDSDEKSGRYHGRVFPSLVGGLVGAVLMIPPALMVGGHIMVAYPIVGGLLGSCTGAGSVMCCRRDREKMILPP